ncbi:MAG: ABC transporter ATP-binding protein/permease [Clostridia bacterium]|nr:ABC transporter ATP-binding protein/permease [Clostridia bacterium]MDE7328265.1 ABC transporter ATP-binding protein/permease [Clostridia bacterium]
MLEIRNVQKTYRPKKGVPVKALDGVSLSFADTGLVFILGKSGSGKSTLLNVIGGLDVADSGEFVIKGKSSKDFSQADFDSYRNTFIGFIFQEYNILNEFSVGQNIALAMKLQGKKADNDALNAILEEVDLAGYGNRKPNELSGGQKQRVAIARALIKEPEIIMADEPTGALDSNTGRQVFDTLKKLSKTKLVIVVSHDREFAEYYGDRVIEFADGKVISDITKETAQSEKESEGVSLVDNKIFHIRKGYKLTSADMKKIQQYIDNASSDTIISMDEKSNNSFCQIARIDQDGNQEVFRDTDNEMLTKENAKYDGSSKFIRSKLPFSHAFKIGSSSLRNKPFRLFITILLCFVSFAMFGLADTIGSFNAKTTTVNSVMDSNYDSVVFSTKLDTGDYFRSLDGASAKDLERIEEKTGMKFNSVLAANYKLPIFDSTKLYGNNNSNYYTQSINGVLTASESKFDEYGFGEFTGRMPRAIDEVVITKYVYEQIALGGLISGDQYSENVQIIKSDSFENIEEFLALEPILYCSDNYGSNGSLSLKIVGVVDSKADASGRFTAYKPSDQEGSSNIMDMFKEMEMQQYFTYGYHSLIYVSSAAYQELYNSATSSKSGIGNYAPGRINLFQSKGGTTSVYSSFTYVANDEALNQLEVLWVDGNARSTLADNEYVVSVEDCYWLFNYLNGNEFNVNNVEINFDQSYFGGIVRITAENLGEISDMRHAIGLTQAAQALTQSQVAKFRAILKEVENEYGAEAAGSLIEELARCSSSIYQYCANATFDEEMTVPTSVNGLTDDQLKCLYVGYVNTDSIGFYSYSDEGWVYLEGGYRTNAVGADCGAIAVSYEYDKLYYSLLLANVEYKFEMDMMSLYFDAASYGVSTEGNYKVVGIYLSKPSMDENGNFLSNRESILVNNAAYEKSQSIEPLVYAFFIAPMPTDRSAVEALIDVHFDESESRCFEMRNGVTYMMDLVTEMLEMLGQVFLWIGVGLAVFSMLLLSNYIAVSISYKKREIGILRAVGAKSSDVFSIFFSESLIIALINFVLAFVVCLVGCTLLNRMLRNDYGFEITLLNFGIRQIGLMLLISVGVALIASFVPVYRLSRKKPIETIRTA